MVSTENVSHLVLYAEDEPLLHEVARVELEDAGFGVALALTGEEAIAFVEANTVAALVTDINLGTGITGWAVARRTREVFPDLPVIYVSGASADAWTSEGVPHSIMIAKPFVPAQIVVALASLLNSSAVG
jgi:CheY-like chemotaxis protein